MGEIDYKDAPMSCYVWSVFKKSLNIFQLSAIMKLDLLKS